LKPKAAEQFCGDLRKNLHHFREWRTPTGLSPLGLSLSAFIINIVSMILRTMLAVFSHQIIQLWKM